MGKYIKVFDTVEEYDAYSGGTSFVSPNISYVRNADESMYDDNEIKHYTDYSDVSGAVQTQINVSISGKQDTLISGTNIKTINNESLLGSGNITIQGGAGGGIDSGTVQTMIDQSISGKTNQSDFTGHTSNTSIHVTTAQTAAWDAKSDFSGSYNDLTDKPTIPTVPTSNTAFTNDAGYITANDITGKTNQSDFTAHTANTTAHVTQSEKNAWNAKSDFSGSYNDLTNKLSAGTNITIVDNVISATGGGGGGSYTAGRGIDITSDVISVSLPISAGTGNYSIIEGGLTSATSECAHAEGWYTKASGPRSHTEGWGTIADGSNSHAEGYMTVAINNEEHAIGKYNVSRLGPEGFSTLFTVGNGTADNARHNAFEIRGNGDIYYFDGTNDVKLQDVIANIMQRLTTIENN